MTVSRLVLIENGLQHRRRTHQPRTIPQLSAIRRRRVALVRHDQCQTPAQQSLLQARVQVQFGSQTKWLGRSPVGSQR
jgi:hypothetical protein